MERLKSFLCIIKLKTKIIEVAKHHDKLSWLNKYNLERDAIVENKFNKNICNIKNKRNCNLVLFFVLKVNFELNKYDVIEPDKNPPAAEKKICILIKIKILKTIKFIKVFKTPTIKYLIKIFSFILKII